ncbi:hypothetical protein [Streptomyces sp. NPDC057690]|uniref:hypothetical protein n=1 Tax=Streptomyces sp. NPDC057690 TaxID=3346214 RepID=UPI0036A0931A
MPRAGKAAGADGSVGRDGTTGTVEAAAGAVDPDGRGTAPEAATPFVLAPLAPPGPAVEPGPAGVGRGATGEAAGTAR